MNYIFVAFFTDNTTIENLRAVCSDHLNLGERRLGQSLHSLFFGSSASKVLYLTEVCFSLQIKYFIEYCKTKRMPKNVKQKF